MRCQRHALGVGSGYVLAWRRARIRLRSRAIADGNTRFFAQRHALGVGSGYVLAWRLARIRLRSRAIADGNTRALLPIISR